MNPGTGVRELHHFQKKLKPGAGIKQFQQILKLSKATENFRNSLNFSDSSSQIEKKRKLWNCLIPAPASEKYDPAFGFRKFRKFLIPAPRFRTFLTPSPGCRTFHNFQEHFRIFWNFLIPAPSFRKKYDPAFGSRKFRKFLISALRFRTFLTPAPGCRKFQNFPENFGVF